MTSRAASSFVVAKSADGCLARAVILKTRIFAWSAFRVTVNGEGETS